jgi:hypothetical protein
VDKFFEGRLPLFFPLVVNYAILVSILVIIAIFPGHPNLPLKVDNSPENFPLGSVTAVFSPDTQVFLNPSTWESWYFLTAANLVVFLALFVVLNWRLEKRERGKRFVFYSVVFLVLPVVANILNIAFIGQSTLGPSGAFYSTVGLLVGFGLINLWIGDKSGGFTRILAGSRIDAVLFVLNGAVGTGFLMLSFFDPSDFFSESVNGYLVGYGIHMFCFYAAVVSCLIYGYFRRSYLLVSGSKDLQLDSVDSERSDVHQSNTFDDQRDKLQWNIEPRYTY